MKEKDKYIHEKENSMKKFSMKKFSMKMELWFDIFYLSAILILSIYFLMSREDIKKIWGIMALILVFGDSFHLVPRIASIITGNKKKFQVALGLGKMITSITMTIFYLFLWHCGLQLFDVKDMNATIIIHILAVIRIVLCLSPKNQWIEEIPSYRWGIYRNIPFIIEGIMVMFLFIQYGNVLTASLNLMWLGILLSYLFYIPVVLWVHKYPMLGMLMLPKSCVYIWIVCMGLGI